MKKKKTWMFQFEPILARNALCGMTRCLIDAFIFHKTVEGHDFWQGQVDAGKLSEEARGCLRKMIEDHRVAYSRPHVRKVDRDRERISA